eukprot:symbB.v1.2.032719.t1/scaffold3963.1/size47363/3
MPSIAFKPEKIGTHRCYLLGMMLHVPPFTLLPQVVGGNHPSVHLKSLWFLTYLLWDKLHNHGSTAMAQGTGCFVVPGPVTMPSV